MLFNILIFSIAGTFTFLLGISVGHSIFIVRQRNEENRKREHELSLLNKRFQIMKESKHLSKKLEDLLYKANVQKEIDNIIGN